MGTVRLPKILVLTIDDFVSAQKDYGKPGMNTSDTHVQHHLAAPTGLSSRWVKHGADAVTILIHVNFAAELHSEYGAPSSAWLNYTVPAAGRTLHVEVYDDKYGGSVNKIQ